MLRTSTSVIPLTISGILSLSRISHQSARISRRKFVFTRDFLAERNTSVYFRGSRLTARARFADRRYFVETDNAFCFLAGSSSTCQVMRILLRCRPSSWVAVNFRFSKPSGSMTISSSLSLKLSLPSDKPLLMDFRMLRMVLKPVHPAGKSWHADSPCLYPLPSHQGAQL